MLGNGQQVTTRLQLVVIAIDEEYKFLSDGVFFFFNAAHPRRSCNSIFYYTRINYNNYVVDGIHSHYNK